MLSGRFKKYNGGTINIAAASQLPILDAGGYYTATNAEAMGQEVGAQLAQNTLDAESMAYTYLPSIDLTQGTIYNGNLDPTNTKVISTNIRYALKNVTQPLLIKEKVRSDGGYWKKAITFYTSAGAYVSRGSFANVTSVVVPATAKYYKVSLSLINSSGVDAGCTPANLADGDIQVFQAYALSERIDAIPSQPIAALQALATFNYSGEKIDVAANKVAMNKFMQLSSVSANSIQGCAAFGDMVFAAHDTMPVISIHNLRTKVYVGQIDFTPEATYHCNNINFGNQYHTTGDPYPLLYVSMENVAQHKCLVYRITVTEGVYAATLVQTITYPVPAAETMYYPNCVIDTDFGIIYVAGYTTESYAKSAANNLRIASWTLPLLAAGDITLDIAQAETFVIPSITATQGAACNNGKIIQVFGVPNYADNKRLLCVIDPVRRSVVSIVNLVTIGITTEPEGLFVWNGGIYMVGIDRYVYRIYTD